MYSATIRAHSVQAIKAGMLFFAIGVKPLSPMNACPKLFRVTHDIEKKIGVPLDLKVKTPHVVDTGLPDVMSLIIFLGT
jgi:hypothetical protein